VTIPLGKPDQVQIVLSTTIAGTVDRLSWRTSLFSGYPVAIRSAGGPPATGDEYEWLGADDWSTPRSFKQLASVIRGWRGTATLIALGFTHIVPGGLDHVLFVLGLFLLASRTRTLLLQISVFTLAHSATLALAALGLVSVPSSIVEPLIAVSIAYIAIENLMTTSISKWRLATVFGFGLLHGLGFAGALADLGISGTDLPVTLVGFNLGVELGQLAVVVTAAVVMRLLPVASKNHRRYLTNPASAAIAAIGLFWAVERTLFN
jgi:hydrogenase/urease accessory protein HupE